MVTGQDTFAAGRLRVKDPTPSPTPDQHDVCNPNPARATALPTLRSELTALEGTLKRPGERALVNLTASLRAGFYQSGNFATACVVSSVMLVATGCQPLIASGAARKQAWGKGFRALYRTGDATPFMRALLR
jgi:hypothetical protein